MKIVLICLIISLSSIFSLFSVQVISPVDFPGYEPGSHFTFPHKAVEYSRHVADPPPEVEYMDNGYSYEVRALAFESAISIFASEKNTVLFRALETRATEQKASYKKEKSDDPKLLRKFEYYTYRRYISFELSVGSIYKVRLDETHPYAFGPGSEWFLMKQSAEYPFLVTGYTINCITDKEPVAGFAGYKYKEKIKNMLVTGSEKIGSSEIIYITDNPDVRVFRKSGRI